MKKTFSNKNYYWRSGIDYRHQSDAYRVGKGEQGVLICEPYKTEILPHWKFKTPELAQQSSEKIYELFLDYLAKNDFPGADMARKYLQMGFTRSRRYANYKGGIKYDTAGETLVKGSGDSEKTISASIFYAKWKQAEAHPQYAALKKRWKENLG